MVCNPTLSCFPKGEGLILLDACFVMTLDPCKLCGVNNAPRFFPPKQYTSVFGGLNKWAVVFSLGLSGTRRPDNTRSLCLTADVPQMGDSGFKRMRRLQINSL